MIGLTTLILSCLLSLESHGEDWPQWRGTNRDGVWRETNLLQSFPAEGLKIRWRCPVGWGWSSPVVSQGRVFVTDSLLVPAPATRERILCFEEASGKQLWSYVYKVTYPEWAFDPGQEVGPSATPIIDKGKIYTLNGNAHLHCLDAENGNLIWERTLAEKYKIEELKCRASPLIDGDHLIVFIGGKPDAGVIALDKNTGKEVWQALDDSISNSSPMIVQNGARRELIIWTCDSVASLDPATGKLLWRYPIRTSNNDAIASPIVRGDYLLISGLMLKLAADQSAPKVLWPDSMVPSRRILSNTSTAYFRGDYIYSARSHGELVCLEATTGREVWENNQVTGLYGGASIHMTPLGDSDSTLLFTDQGDLILARLTPGEYREISRTHLLDPTTLFGSRKMVWSPPTYANHHVFARSGKELICASLEAKP